MLQFKVPKPDGGFIYFFGVSEANLEKLKAGKPLAKSLKAVNPDSEDEIVLFYGKTEEEMAQVLRDAGVEIREVRDARGDGQDG